MTERIPLDHLTSDQLDALHQRIDTLEHVAAGNKRHVQLIVPDLERAEAALARVRSLAEQWQASVRPGEPHPGADAILTALDQPAPAATAHLYLSTGCLHGEHGYCSNVDGMAGLKKPAQCKFCAAPCTCPCHADGEPAATQATDPPLLLPHDMATTLHRTLGQLLGDQDAQAIARLRALHREDYGSCAECTHNSGVPFPCPTIRAIDQNQEQP